MRVFIFIAFFVSVLFGDFFVVSGDQKIRMQKSLSGQLDFSHLASVPKLEQADEKIYILSDDASLNHRHLNIRLTPLDLEEHHYVFDEFTQKSDIAGVAFKIELGGVSIKEGAMLQILYNNEWHNLFLGDPLKSLEELFEQKELNPKEAYAKIQKARLSFPHAKKLEELTSFWHVANQEAKDPHAKYKKQEFVDFSKIKNEP